jgi:FAD/FMN-containing dehydrogenase
MMSSSGNFSELQKIPSQSEIIFKGDERLVAYQGDVVLAGNPDALVRARDIQDVSQIMAYCHHHSIPVTFSGGRTGLTGAASAEGGLLIVTEKMNKILDWYKQGEQHTVTAQAGIYLGDLKQAVADEALFYPPDPTSFREAVLGGTVATNAKGEDALLYGNTRDYIRSMRIVCANGEIRELRRGNKRSRSQQPSWTPYHGSDDPLELMIGSEGTLAFIAELTLDLLPEDKAWWAALAFFPSIASSIDFINALFKYRRPRALEFIDARALSFMAKGQDVPALRQGAQAALYWKQEYVSDAEKEETLQKDLLVLEGILKDAGSSPWAQDTLFASTEAEKTRFRHWRHYIPSYINEAAMSFIDNGGGKVASDWWVPRQKIREAIEIVYQESQEEKLEAIIFGHIGQGHPHVNYIAQNDDEKKRARHLLVKQCERAVAWGGGVCGEHGIGKLFKELLAIQVSSAEIKRMNAIKREWDPHWILGRGTIIDVPDC